MRARDPGIARDGVVECPPRLVTLIGHQADRAEVHEQHRVRRIGGARAIERGDRVAAAARPRLRERERDQHLLVRSGVGRRRREHGDRLGRGAAFGEIAAEQRRGLGIARPERVRAPQRRDRAVEIAAVVLHLRESHPGDPHLRLLPHERPRAFEGCRSITRRIEPDDLLELRVDRDEALRVVLLGVTIARRGSARCVAEAFQARPGLGAFGDPRRRRAGEGGGPQESPQGGGFRRTRRDRVSLLLRIDGEVVQLGQGQVDVFHSVADEAAQRRPAAVERGRQRFEVRDRMRIHGLAPGGRKQAGPPEVLRRRDTEHVEDRGDDVDVPRFGADDSRREQGRDVHDERHSQRRLVREHAVCRFAVIAERLAVVGRQDDRGAAPLAGVQNRTKERLERRIRRGDLSQIRIRLEPRRERLGRRIGGMRLVQMDPAERALRRVPVEPSPREGDRLGAAPFLLEHRRPRRRVHEPIVVDGEPAHQTKARREGKGADERAGGVTPRLEQRRQGRLCRRKPEARVVADPVVLRIQARQDAGV